MSWSASARGNADALIAHAQKQFAAAVKRVKPNDPPEVYLGHEAQRIGAERVVQLLALTYPTETLEVHASGHANGDGSGYVSVTYTLVNS